MRMNDTSSDIEKKMLQMISFRSPIERLKMMSDMFESGKKLVITGLQNENRSLNNAQIRAKTFYRIYGDYFSQDRTAVIVQKIPNMQADTEFL